MIVTEKRKTESGSSRGSAKPPRPDAGDRASPILSSSRKSMTSDYIRRLKNFE
jgi:hypothetical protein